MRKVAVETWMRTLALGLLLGQVALAGCGGGDEDALPEIPPEEGVVLLSPEQLVNAEVETAEARVERSPLTFSVPGVVQPPDTAQMMVGSFVEGRVERVLVLEGDGVTPGAPLVMIHSHELADWQRELTAAEARVAFGSTALARSRRLLAEGAVSREEVERREMEFRLAEADRERAQEVVEHLHPEGGNVVIQAPREGIVFRVLTGPGEAVVPGAPLVELGSAAVLWVVGGVPENQVPELERGDPVAITFPALPGMEAQGRVISLGSRVDPALRTVELRVQMDPIPAGVRTGTLAALRLPSGTHREGILLPADAVQRLEGEPYVFLEEAPGRFRAVRVEVLTGDGGQVMVAGVEAGSRVVIRGAYSLRAVLEGFQGLEDEG